MFHFSKISLKRLSQCHIDLQILFKEVIKHYDCSILCGYRGEEAQNKLYYARPQRTKALFPKSKHNKKPSLAIDVVPYPIDWKDYDRFYFFGGFVKGIATMLLKDGVISHKIIWGRDWDDDNDFDDQSLNDFPHFHIVGHAHVG